MPIPRQDYAVSSPPNEGFADSRILIVRALEDQLGKNVLEMWFQNGDSVFVERGRVEIRGDSEFQLNRIRTRFASSLKQAVDSILGAGFPIEFLVVADVPEVNQGAPSSIPIKPTAGSSETRDCSIVDGGHSDKNTAETKSVVERRHRGVESFWFGESNRLAQAGVSQMFDQIGQMSPFVLYGPTGCGKTHLLESIVFEARRKHRLKRCVYLSAEQFTTYFVQALHGTGLPVFRRKYRDLDVLAVDDVQFFAGKNATLAEFQYTVDNLARNGKQVILASDRPPIDLGRLGSEITARMMSGLVCPLNYPDATGREKIVREICRVRGFSIPDEVISLVSQNLARDVRRLSGAVNRLHALSTAMNGRLDLEVARHALTDLFSISRTMTSISRIEKVVCEFCGVKPAELKSVSRQKKISAARMLAMYLSRQHTSNAFSEIGDYFGGRSHSTVIAAQQKVVSWLESNQAIDLPRARYPAKDAITRIESSLRIG